jgi:hypothetical protein
MMTRIRRALLRIYYKLFPTYLYHERVMVHYDKANRLLKATANLPEREQWVIDTEYEDLNKLIGMVHLCRRERIHQ